MYLLTMSSLESTSHVKVTLLFSSEPFKSVSGVLVASKFLVDAGPEQIKRLYNLKLNQSGLFWI